MPDVANKMSKIVSAAHRSREDIAKGKRKDHLFCVLDERLSCFAQK